MTRLLLVLLTLLFSLSGAAMGEYMVPPLAGDTISYTYDELGRVLQRSVGSDVVTVTYDNQGRVDSSANSLGSFAYNYITGTGRLSSIVASTGHTTNFDYDSVVNDFRLGEIENLGPSGTPVSKFNYDYNPAFLISEWTQQAGSGTPLVDAMSYDASDRLTGITRSLSSSVVKRFAFRNDAAGNLVRQQVDDIPLGEVTALGGAMNRANQLLNLKDEGPVHVSGTLDEPGLVTIDDVVIATDVARDGFEAWAEVDAFGKFNIRALDYSDNETSKTVSVALESPGDNSFTYDKNGNMLSGLDGAVYTWDVNDRLRKAETGTYSVSLDYNAAGLPYHLVQMNGMTEVAERWFIWDGFSLVEERYSLNGGPDKVRRIYAEGEEDDGNDLYYSYDHLGSVREITDASGSVVSRYDYTAYGSLSLLTGSAPGSGLLTTGFTGHIHFQWQGMELVIAPYRIYDPRLGRWLSRDPIAEAGGINLYQYVGGNPINLVDATGFTADYPDWYNPVDWMRYGFFRPLAERFTSSYVANTVECAASRNNETYALLGSSQRQGAAQINGDVTGALTEFEVEAGLLVAAGTIKWINSLEAGGTAQKTANSSAFQRMLKAGGALDKGGLTKAGRALQKHGSRPGSVFPQATGNPVAMNQQGQKILQEILSSPSQSIKSNRFGGRDIFDAGTGRGVRYDESGNMMGFLEP